MALSTNIVPGSTNHISDHNTIAGVVNALPVTTTVTTLTGTTAGSAQWVQPIVGTYKKFLVYLSGYANTTATAQTITFPTPFTTAASITSSGGISGLSVSLTALTLPASMAAGVTDTGVVTVEGI